MAASEPGTLLHLLEELNVFLESEEQKKSGNKPIFYYRAEDAETADTFILFLKGLSQAFFINHAPGIEKQESDKSGIFIRFQSLDQAQLFHERFSKIFHEIFTTSFPPDEQGFVSKQSDNNKDVGGFKTMILAAAKLHNIEIPEGDLILEGNTLRTKAKILIRIHEVELPELIRVAPAAEGPKAPEDTLNSPLDILNRVLGGIVEGARTLPSNQKFPVFFVYQKQESDATIQCLGELVAGLVKWTFPEPVPTEEGKYINETNIRPGDYVLPINDNKHVAFKFPSNLQFIHQFEDMIDNLNKLSNLILTAQKENANAQGGVHTEAFLGSDPYSESKQADGFSLMFNALLRYYVPAPIQQGVVIKPKEGENPCRVEINKELLKTLDLKMQLPPQEKMVLNKEMLYGMMTVIPPSLDRN